MAKLKSSCFFFHNFIQSPPQNCFSLWRKSATLLHLCLSKMLSQAPAINLIIQNISYFSTDRTNKIASLSLCKLHIVPVAHSFGPPGFLCLISKNLKKEFGTRPAAGPCAGWDDSPASLLQARRGVDRGSRLPPRAVRGGLPDAPYAARGSRETRVFLEKEKALDKISHSAYTKDVAYMRANIT